MFKWYGKLKLKLECNRKNHVYEMIGKATCYQEAYGKTYHIVYTFMVNGYGHRKISINHNLRNDILDKGDQYKHPMYVKWYKSWEDGALQKIPVDDTKRDKDKLWHTELNFYYHYYIHRGEIFVKKIILKPIEDTIVTEEIQYVSK